MSVREFCSREVVITSSDTGIVEAAQLMRQYHVGDIVIVESGPAGNVPIGILTDRDIVVEIIAAQVSPDSLTVADVMSEDLLVAREEDGIWMTLQRMQGKGVRRVPVVGEKGELVGILSIDDVLELLADEINLLAKVTGRGQKVEQESRT